ncbi:MAG: YraN family protein [Anaerolineae bacterium]
MTADRVGLGRRGETLATEALQAEGFVLVDRNWRCPYGEVDLVVARGADLYFIEVRTRRTLSAPSPEQTLTPRKLTHMENTARAYLGAHDTRADSTWHLSFVAVTMDRGGRVRRITFYPDLDGDPVDLLRRA